MRQKLENLKFRRKNLRCENADHRWFIPQLSLSPALSKDAIRDALRDAGMHLYHLDEVVEEIVTDSVKIFAVLVLIDQVNHISKLSERGELHDRRLPFSIDILEKQLLLTFPKDFYEKQWELATPTFHRGTINKFINGRFVLPFTEEQQIGEGAFGNVYKITLHPNHQSLGYSFEKKS